MKISYRTEPHDQLKEVVKGIDISLTPIEGLLFHEALLQFAHTLDNNETDRIDALRMCDEFEAKTAEMAGVREI